MNHVGAHVVADHVTTMIEPWGPLPFYGTPHSFMHQPLKTRDKCAIASPRSDPSFRDAGIIDVRVTSNLVTFSLREQVQKGPCPFSPVT